jgi:endonuclease YncB( thermonuclease family)
MSEAKGTYKHYRLCDEAPCVKGSCMACVYDEGRASREMLRDALLTVQRWVSSLRCGDGMETLIQVMIKKVIEEDGGSK